MTSVRTIFKHSITSSQRNAAAAFWRQLLQRDRQLPLTEIDKTEPIKEDVFRLTTQKDSGWPKKVADELDTLIFEQRDNLNLKIESDLFPKGILLQAANNSHVPPAVFPNHISMSFTPDGNLSVNNRQYSATQILGLFAKPKSQDTGSNTYIEQALNLHF